MPSSATINFDEILIYGKGILAIAGENLSLSTKSITGDNTGSLNLFGSQTLLSLSPYIITGSIIYVAPAAYLSGIFNIKYSTLYVRGGLNGSSLIFKSGGVLSVLDGTTVNAASITFTESSSNTFVCYLFAYL